jgi:UDP-2,4-diacetamido-2,4,6-trideoxy-beta-L-altropyranose hydrolase
MIRGKEFFVHEVPVSDNFEFDGASDNDSENKYISGLGVSQDQDARETITVIKKNKPDWLIVDHYGLGQIWEKQLRSYVSKIMVIDDLANRPHDCDLLLDQNYFIKGEARYENFVPPTCTKLFGPQYALLRPEFAEVRKQLKPRTGKVQSVFIFFGSTDPYNITGKTLDALSFQELSHLDVDVVIGLHNPNRIKIESQVKMRLRTKLHVQVDNMAELMAQADLVLGSGGTTTWERLCLGLPSLVITVADNQKEVSSNLHKSELVYLIGDVESANKDVISFSIGQVFSKKNLNVWSALCMRECDGLGVAKVVEQLI